MEDINAHLESDSLFPFSVCCACLGSTHFLFGCIVSAIVADLCEVFGGQRPPGDVLGGQSPCQGAQRKSGSDCRSPFSPVLYDDDTLFVLCIQRTVLYWGVLYALIG